MDKSKWVDFKAVKQAVTIAMVLDHYGVKLKRTGNELRGKCPIHKGEGQESFHASTEKNAFQCFSCGAKGNVLDFVAALEQCSVRDAALKLADWYSVSGPGAHQPASAPAGTPPKDPTGQPATEEVGERAESNRPLGFQLKGIDHSHPYLAGRGITTETAQAFGVGFFPGKGSMSGRVVIPIHNERGELVAYAGRSIDQTEPKYKLPAGFRKAAVLYNLHRAIKQGSEHLVVVEGFFDCLRLFQAGFENAVALMGCTLSEQQESLLLSHAKRVTLLLGGDQAGREAAAEIAQRLVRRLFVRLIELPEGKQPDGLDPAQLRALR